MSEQCNCFPNFNKVCTSLYKYQVSKLGVISIIKIFLPILYIVGCFAPNCKENSKLLVKGKIGGAATSLKGHTSEKESAKYPIPGVIQIFNLTSPLTTMHALKHCAATAVHL